MKRTLLALVAIICFSLTAMAADISGKWTRDAAAGGRGGPQTYTFKVDGNKLTGSLTTQQGDTPIADGKIDGDKISFSITRSFGGNDTKIEYTGTVKGDTIDLSFDFGRGPVTMTLKRAQ